MVFPRAPLSSGWQEVADTRDDISKLMDRSRKNSDQKSSLLALYPGHMTESENG